ncbi:hypothetical protein M407DRAFT_32976 [Tulasnella calospora MUT 4182]|uniref:Fork-head domain-containing protein n=1 Tax=Tulasnella calospora MUT 4182 TaxID=1051891 RepID=A0A0C3Q346_9AGAM|nr:hypothetical protein M407DRAFT_32976 [Tulasnella calospora MUT 4182]
MSKAAQQHTEPSAPTRALNATVKHRGKSSSTNLGPRQQFHTPDYAVPVYTGSFHLSLPTIYQSHGVEYLPAQDVVPQIQITTEQPMATRSEVVESQQISMQPQAASSSNSLQPMSRVVRKKRSRIARDETVAERLKSILTGRVLRLDEVLATFRSTYPDAYPDDSDSAKRFYETVKTTLSKRNEFVKYEKMSYMRGKGDLWHYDPTRVPGLKTELRKKGLLAPRDRALQKRGSTSSAASSTDFPSTTLSFMTAPEIEYNQPELPGPSSAPTVLDTNFPFDPSFNQPMQTTLYVESGSATSAQWSFWEPTSTIPAMPGAEAVYTQTPAPPSYNSAFQTDFPFTIYPPYSFSR